MVGGVHFLPDDPPDMIARKLLRVNLSDMAAMGAVPLHYLLTVSVPRGTPEAWFAAFAAGLAADQARYGVTLLGGDTTSTPGPFSLSATMIGHVAPGQALAAQRRARRATDLWVTGTHRRRRARPARSCAASGPTRKARWPSAIACREPRLGLALHGVVHAAMDVSDGLVQDAGHIARASGVSLVIETALVPLSAAGREAGPAFVESGVAGGDDYELLLAVPPDRAGALVRVCAQSGVAVTRIGRFGTGPGEVTGRRGDGSAAELGGGGWSHF